MLNSFKQHLKANENAKQLTDLEKQAGVELMMEKESLINKIEQLKELTRLKDADNEMLQDQILYNFQETTNSISSLEGSFLCMQKDVEEIFKVESWLTADPGFHGGRIRETCLVMNNTRSENDYDVNGGGKKSDHSAVLKKLESRDLTPAVEFE
ncbi:hypothetical protein U1Q18_011669 [Sarracenia purpurea var. burkii]